IETAVEAEDSVLEKYLSGEEITAAELKRCIRKGVLTQKFFPVLCGTAFKNKGVQLLLDAVVDYLPSPQDLIQITGISVDSDAEIIRKIDDNDPFSALAFKIMTDPF